MKVLLTGVAADAVCAGESIRAGRQGVKAAGDGRDLTLKGK